MKPANCASCFHQKCVGDSRQDTDYCPMNTRSEIYQAAEQVYKKWLYDTGDVFTLGSDGEIATAVTAASEAQFETEAASLTGESGATPMSISYRTGALTTGISAFQLGT